MLSACLVDVVCVWVLDAESLMLDVCLVGVVGVWGFDEEW